MDKNEEKIKFMDELIKDLLTQTGISAELKVSMERYQIFRRELTKESDRGCALLAASHLDYMLETLLRKKLIGNSKHLDNLFGFTGPVGSFSSRILLCYSLGLISIDFLHDIQIIRKIRNDFGHSPEIISFDDQKMSSLCNNLKFNVHESTATSRHKFLNSVSGISGQLEGAIISCEPFVESPPIDLKKRKEIFGAIMSKINNAFD